MKIHEIQLLTHNLEATNHFYQEILGLEVINAGKSKTSFAAGFSVLTFHQSGDNEPVYHFAFNIPNNRFEEAMEWVGSKLDLIQIGPSGTVADFKSWNAKAFYFYDNNRNIVEMIARYDLNNSSAGSFDGSSVYSVSEVGAVVKNPKAFAQELLINYGLHFFSRQQPMEDFIAVGDDEGLFIIVTENRFWYPTQTRSTHHWAQVSIGLPGRSVEIIL